MNYCVVAGETRVDLQDAVNQMMRKGWQPTGGVAVRPGQVGPGRFAGYYSITNWLYLQAMIRTDAVQDGD